MTGRLCLAVAGMGVLLIVFAVTIEQTTAAKLADPLATPQERLIAGHLRALAPIPVLSTLVSLAALGASCVYFRWRIRRQDDYLAQLRRRIYENPGALSPGAEGSSPGGSEPSSFRENA